MKKHKAILFDQDGTLLNTRRISKISYGDRLTAVEYRALRDAMGWGKLTDAQAGRGLENSACIVAARDGEQAVGMARLLFDYGYVAYLADVIVLPEYQGMGIGRAMLERIFAFLKENTWEGEYLMCGLHAAEGKEAFYERFGFVRRPCEGMGAGMVLKWMPTE